MDHSAGKNEDMAVGCVSKDMERRPGLQRVHSVPARMGKDVNDEDKGEDAMIREIYQEQQLLRQLRKIRENKQAARLKELADKHQIELTARLSEQAERHQEELTARLRDQAE